MKLLLDTHIFLWSLLEPEKLSDEIADLLDNPDIDKYISAVTGWEIVIKFAKGSLILPKPPRDFVMENVLGAGILLLPISINDTFAVAELPDVHKDPFDRMIIAQARQHEMFVVTNDRRFSEYEVGLIEI